jgi:hypothetical protein
MGKRTVGMMSRLAVVMLLLAGCSGLEGGDAQGGKPATQAVPISAPTLEPTATATLPPPTVTPSPTLSPIPPTSTLAPELSLWTVPAGSPPRAGSFDVYLGQPNTSGSQILRWLDVSTHQVVTEIRDLSLPAGEAVRAGQYVYLVWTGNLPMRINTAGATDLLEFALPPANAGVYQLLPSANGHWLSWVYGHQGVFSFFVSDPDGGGVRLAATLQAQPDDTIRLLRLTNDGRTLFFDHRPAAVTDTTLFNGFYDLYALDTASGVISQLPGEPACGQGLVCDAHISPDGAYLVRTLPPATAGAPIVVTNLVTGAVVGRFRPIDIPAGAAFELGYPFLTPGGELVFMEAYGPPGLETYLLGWANLVTGEQRLIANLGSNRHRPLGWAGDGFILLTTREPAFYDTWQINIRDGQMRQVAAMLFLGHIDVPVTNP